MVLNDQVIYLEAKGNIYWAVILGGVFSTWTNGGKSEKYRKFTLRGGPSIVE